MDSNFLAQVKPIFLCCTRVTDFLKTMIDLIFVNNYDGFIADGVIPLTISEHSLIYCSLKVGVPNGIPRTVEFRSYKSCLLCTRFQKHPMADEEDIYDAVSTWNALFLDVANNHAPTKKQRVSGINPSPPPPWVTPVISDLMRDRDYYHRKAKNQALPTTGNYIKTFGSL